jgi:GT2 family glycosyltransferase
MGMKISIIIPNYNGASLLEKNIPKVCAGVTEFIAKNKNQVEIIIVDDCSVDKSIEVIEKLREEHKAPGLGIVLQKNRKNLGFSSSVNNGAKKATGTLLVLLNSDAYPERQGGFFTHALPYFNDPRCFAVGFMDKSIEQDGKIVLRGRGVGEWRKGFLIHRRGEVDKKETLWVSGGSGIFRKEMWNLLGGLNEMYNPFYWEDIDLSYRALKSGYKIFFESTCVVIHEHEKGAIKSSRSSFSIKRIVYRNQMLFSWVNATDPMLLLSHIFWLPLHLARALLRRDFAMIFGFCSALLKLPKVLESRKQMTTLIRRNDKEAIKTI